MTDLEARIRRELADMADRVEITSDTWGAVHRRSAARVRRRRAALAVAAAVFVAAIGATALVRPWVDDARLTTAAAWSADDLRVRERVDVGSALLSSTVFRPRSSVASDGSALWFSRLGTTSVSHLDPVSGTVRSTADTLLPLVGVAVAPDSVWAVADGHPTVVRIDRRTEEVTRVMLRTGDVQHPATGGVTYGDRAVWVPVAHGRLARIDLETGATEVTDVGVPLQFVTAGDGVLWGVGEAGTVIRFDLRRRQVTGRAELGPGEYRIDDGEGAVWVLDTTRGDLVELAPDLRSMARVHTGPDPRDLAVGAGAIWVTDAFERELVVVDPGSTEIVAELDLGGRPDEVVVAGDEIWISDPDAGTLVSVALR